jgi:prevent-host-death family protein
VKTITVVDAKAHFSALLAEVEGGQEIAVTRHGRVVARLVPDRPRVAADVFRDFWEEGATELEAPPDSPAEDVATLDD